MLLHNKIKIQVNHKREQKEGGERRDTKEQFQKSARIRGWEGSRITILNRTAIYDARAKFLHVTIFPLYSKNAI